MSASPKDFRLTAEQMAALNSLPADNTTGLKSALLSVSADRYIDPAFFEREKEAIFKRDPIPVAASGQLPQPGTFVRQDFMNLPLLLTRAKDGVVRAFLNVCRHRGAVLCPSHDTQQGGKISCPYHAWTYSLDGQLVGIPRAELFDGIDKSKYGLTELSCLEAGGFIWVGLTPGADVDFSHIEGKLAAELEAVGLGAMRVHSKAVYDIKANWKLIMDTMLDSYHVTRLHKDTVAKFFVDTPVHVEQIGPHLRNGSARGNFDKASLIDDLKHTRQHAVFSYQLFPNAVAVQSPDYFSLGILRPVSHNRTLVDYLLVTDHPEDDEALDRKLVRSFDLMEKVFGDEDFWASSICQEGLDTGDLPELTLGGMEGQMRLWHDILEGQMARPPAPANNRGKPSARRVPAE